MGKSRIPMEDILSALLSYLERKQTEDQEYQVLKCLLEICAATLERANRCWQSGELQQDESHGTLLGMVQYGFAQFLPFLLSQLDGGWRELFLYLPREQRRMWFQELTQRHTLSLLRATLTMEGALEAGEKAKAKRDTF